MMISPLPELTIKKPSPSPSSEEEGQQQQGGPYTTILIVGATAGIGKECARLLAQKDGVIKIILGCRSKSKAIKAKEDLERLTGWDDMFDILIIDITNFDSINQAVQQLLEEEEGGSNNNSCNNKSTTKIDGLILNAGGFGDPTKAVEVDNDESNALNILKLNLLGHVYLVDRLIERNLLSSSSNATTVIYAGSRSSVRGKPDFGIPKPDFKTSQPSIEDFSGIITGTSPILQEQHKKDATTCYMWSKLLGALWIAHMARQYPSIRFVTICPGMTAGTNQFVEFPFLTRLMYSSLIQIFKWFGKAQSLEIGAQRFVDALFDFDETYQSGIFYARDNETGKVMVDQVCNNNILKNHIAQDNCNHAIHTFLPK